MNDIQFSSLKTTLNIINYNLEKIKDKSSGTVWLALGYILFGLGYISAGGFEVTNFKEFILLVVMIILYPIQLGSDIYIFLH